MSRERGSSLKGKISSRGNRVVSPMLFLSCLFVAFSMILGYDTSSLYQSTSQTSGSPASSSSASSSSQSSSGSQTQNGDPNAANTVVIGEYTAVSAGEEEGRITNLRLAADSINGLVINPGESFSFNDAVGDVEHDERYQEAPVIIGNAIEQGRGGGTCQVSSALYYAALCADMRIVERHPHSAVVDYAFLGLDATILYGVMDLKIANDSEYPVTISAVAEGQSVTVKILGQPLEEGLTIKPSVEIIEHHQAGTPVASESEWNKSLEDTEFYLVVSSRDYHRNGELTDSVLLSRDRYAVIDNSTVRLPSNQQSMK